ncbi:putative quinol monooxygenase [Aeoliella mucimassa]|uniref:Putative quinol monooxygenase YgiN n=1 Tax=Aeoliella mucimassa TaxID=2527972 RepID=A0A518AJ52_9BACT|nr:putative quinol monooxygenase [Aeoliella mucimassa]QDU54730.1 putative quinol monooxygenase YgiN [Aeoliella mucimassa]
MIHVIAALTTAPGKRDELIEAFKQVAPTVRAEDGCIEYNAAVDVQTPLDGQSDLRDDVLTVVEKWESIDALKAHLATSHMEQFFTAMGDVITGVSLQVLSPV